MEKWIRELAQIGPEEAEEVGGKALGLARLSALGLPVPPGFAVTASFFEEVRSYFPDEPEPETLARRLPAPLRAELERALGALGSAPAGYAVRSSAAEEDGAKASFAGVHESYLSVPRRRVIPELFRCWSSAFAEQALDYRRRMGFPVDSSRIRMAVVVQTMLRPSAAGVLFTRESGAPDSDLVANVVAGGGAELIRGRVRPHVIRLPGNRRIPERGSATGAPLPASTLEELVFLALRAEEAWGAPLDIEWALEGAQIYLLQARPITACPPPAGASTASTSGLSSTEETLWTRANLRELLPDLPSPLFLSLAERVDWAESSRRLGLREIPEGRWVRVIEGRPYFNLSLMGEVGARFGFPISLFARTIGVGADLAGIPETSVRPFLSLLRHPVSWMNLLRLQLSARREILRFFDRVHQRVRHLRGEDPHAAPEARLLELFRESDEEASEFLHFLQVAFTRVASRMLTVEALLPSGFDADRFISASVAAGEKNVSVRQGLDLLALARQARSEGRVVQYLLEAKDAYRNYETELQETNFLPAFRAYLALYGHRGIHESDPGMPLYTEDPGFLLRAIGAIAADPRSPDPEATLRLQEQTAESAWRELRRALSWPERILPVRVFLLRRAVQNLKEAMALREQVRFEGMRVSAEYRRCLREVGRRFASRRILEQGGDLPFLRREEIEAILAGKESGDGCQERVTRRKREMERQRSLPMPNLLRESEIPRLKERRSAPAGEAESYQGLPVGPGKVEGRVVVLEGPHEMERVQRGDILVAPTIDPSWIPLFTLAAGLVVEMGGTLSHGSIIAREYGLPAVVNIPGITRTLKTGDRVFLDGSAGLVRRLAES